jgi:hypothetical protein
VRAVALALSELVGIVGVGACCSKPFEPNRCSPTPSTAYALANVGTVQQTIQMPLAEYETFAKRVKTTLNNGTAPFTLDVWLGTGFANKICQFVKPGSSLTAQFLPTDIVAVSMTLRIYDI